MKRLVKNVITDYPVVILVATLSLFSIFCAVKSGLAIMAVPVLLLTSLLFFIDKRQKVKLVISQNLYRGLLSANEVAQSFAIATETEETLETIFLALKEILPSSKRILLFWIKQEGWKKTIEGRAAFGMESSEIKKFVFLLDEKLGIVPRVAITRNSFETLDAKNDYYCDQNFVEQSKIFAFIATPITVAQKTLGVFLIETDGEKIHTESEIKMFSFFANEVGIALENIRLYNEVELLSVTDGLTGLYNHRHFQKILGDDLNRSSRYKHSLSLLMLDIDFFKDYNDTFGHPTGDAVLAAVARIIQINIRNTDFAARYGGEEFCMILTETEKSGALLKAEEIRRRIEENQFLNEKKQPTKNLTVSIGVAGFPEDAISKEALIKKADEALYRSKKEGRNRVSGA
ncbi:MAG: sensor domain-containing diguanylate cyclase [Candidatus Omnitrophota bacterium]|nr:sensor domain-containing diguanylate cyclase [Candidatus Omnitrophota bacterium]